MRLPAKVISFLSTIIVERPPPPLPRRSFPRHQGSYPSSSPVGGLPFGAIMVYKKCPDCGEATVPVARKTCPSCGFNYKTESAASPGEAGADETPVATPKDAATPSTGGVGVQEEVKTEDKPEVKTEKKPVKEEEADEETESTRQARPKRNVRKPHLLGDELAVAVAVESSFKSASKGKQIAGKRGAKPPSTSPSSVRGGKPVKRPGSGVLARPATGSSTQTVRSLLAAQQQRRLEQQRRPRGRPRVGPSGHADELDGSRESSSSSSRHPSRFSGGGKSSTRGALTSGGPSTSWHPANGRKRGNNDDDDDDDDDFGLTSHHKRQISDSLDQTKGQRTRQLIPRRAASVSLSSLQLQQQQQRFIASAASDSPSRGSPASAEELNFYAESDSNSPVSSKSASPCSPEMIEDRYERLPAYRRLQYSLVLGDINQKFLNQSFHPL